MLQAVAVGDEKSISFRGSQISFLNFYPSCGVLVPRFYFLSPLNIIFTVSLHFTLKPLFTHFILWETPNIVTASLYEMLCIESIVFWRKKLLLGNICWGRTLCFLLFARPQVCSLKRRAPAFPLWLLGKSTDTGMLKFRTPGFSLWISLHFYKVLGIVAL